MILLQSAKAEPAELSMGMKSALPSFPNRSGTLSSIEFKTSMQQNSGQTSPLLSRLQLLQFADSALPIGALSHSFGLETLIADDCLDVTHLGEFFRQWLSGVGHTEAIFCVHGYQTSDQRTWTDLNALASAMRPARESRHASLVLGRRFKSVAEALISDRRLELSGPVHISTAFGLVGSILGVSLEESVSAYLHQAMFGAVSVCQRLLPLGQSAAMQLLWKLKPQMACTIERACAAPVFEDLYSVQPMLEIASMRHPILHTRLFIS